MTCLDKSFEKSPDEQAFYLYGLSFSYELLADYPKAYELSKQVIGKSTKVKDGFMQALRLAIQTGHLKEGEIYLAKARILYPNNSEFLYYKGLLAEKSGDTRGKAAAYREAIAMNNFVGGLVSFGWLMRTTHNFQKYDGVRDLIIKEHESSMPLRVNNAGLARELCMMYTIDGRYGESISAINKALEIDPANKYFALNKSLSMHKMGQQEAASKLAIEAESELPEEDLTPEDLFALAMNKMYLKRNDEARAYLKKAINYPEPEAIHIPFQQMAMELLKGI